jgi:hypothetical protein
MFENAKLGLKALKESVAEAEPATLEGKTAMAMMEVYAEAERVAAAGKALMARRVADSGAWKSSGEKSPAHLVANKTGTSVGQAVGVLETAARLAELPETEEAMRSGELSETQVKEIASAAAAAPQTERELLKVAATEDLTTLKERCARVKAAAVEDESERYARVHRRRRLRTWTDQEGAFRLDAVLTPDSGAKVMAALEPYREQVFRAARKQDRREPYEAYAADALVELTEDAGSGSNNPARMNPKNMVHVFVDHEALKRGHTENGEMCEIAGVGPVPVATARALASDAWLKVLVSDGVDIMTVSHPGRTIPARIRTALAARGYVCARPGCGARRHLQIDHVKPVHAGGPTELANLDWLCPHDHYLKTHKGYILAGPPGARTWHPPGEPEADP